jgi:hypothetical protein
VIQWYCRNVPDIANFLPGLLVAHTYPQDHSIYDALPQEMQFMAWEVLTTAQSKTMKHVNKYKENMV